jgi:glycosyltransferase involved in cell wall biosynthesis
MIVDCNPEFGIELTLALPYAYWLHEQGKLEKVITSKGMKPFYYFCDNVEEKYDYRTIDNAAAGLNSLPNSWIYGNEKNAELYKNEWKHWESFRNVDRGCGILNYEKWKMPDYINQYKNDKFVFKKPFVVVANRYNWEHGQPPVGYFNIKCLYEMFNYLTEKGYIVIYKRPKNTEFPLDQNEMNTLQHQENITDSVEGIGEISDYDLTKYYDDVVLFDDVLSDTDDYTYNELQLNLFANSKGFIGISGGSTLLLNLFQLPTLTYLYNSSDLRDKFWENENGIKNIKNYYYMMNPNTIPFVDKNCRDMQNNNHKRFLDKIKENF